MLGNLDCAEHLSPYCNRIYICCLLRFGIPISSVFGLQICLEKNRALRIQYITRLPWIDIQSNTAVDRHFLFTSAGCCYRPQNDCHVLLEGLQKLIFVFTYNFYFQMVIICGKFFTEIRPDQLL